MDLRFLLRTLCVIILGVAPVITLNDLRVTDRMGPLGFHHQLWVNDAEASSDAQVTALRREVGRLAVDRGMAIAYHEDDPSNPLARRTLHLVDGTVSQRHAEWLQSGYPRLATNSWTRVAAWTPSSQRFSDPRGYYLVEGRRADLEDLADLFRTNGYSSTPQPYVTPTTSAISVLTGGPGKALFAASLLLALLNGSGFNPHLRRGIDTPMWRRFPFPSRQFALQMAARQGSLSLLAVVLLGAFIACTSWLLIGGNTFHMPLYVASTTLVVGGLSLVYSCAYLLVRERRTSQLAARGVSNLVRQYAVRAAVMVLAASVTSGALLQTAQVLQQRADADLPADIAGASHVLLDGSLGREGTERDLFEGVSTTLLEEDKEGRLVVAADGPRLQLDRVAPKGTNVHQTMLVNAQYMESEVLHGRLSAALMEGAGDNARVLLFPSSLTIDAENVAKAMVSATIPSTAGALEGTVLHAVAYRNGLRFPTYGNALTEQPQIVRDPIVLVLPSTSTLHHRDYVYLSEELAVPRSERGQASNVGSTAPGVLANPSIGVMLRERASDSLDKTLSEGFGALALLGLVCVVTLVGSTVGNADDVISRRPKSILMAEAALILLALSAALFHSVKAAQMGQHALGPVRSSVVQFAQEHLAASAGWAIVGGVMTGCLIVSYLRRRRRSERSPRPANDNGWVRQVEKVNT